MTSIQYIIQGMDDLFMDYEWNLITNEKNKFSYVSNIYPLDFFSIKYNDIAQTKTKTLNGVN